MTDPAPEDLTDDELLLRWRALSAGARARITAAIADELEHYKRSPKKGGPRPMPARPRWVQKRYAVFAKKHGKGPVKALWPLFLKTLPVELRALLPKATARSRNAQTDKTVSNLLTRGQNLNNQRPELRRLVAIMRSSGNLSLSGNPDRNTIRAAIEAARAGRREDFKAIKDTADEYAFWRDSATRALLGDLAVDARSFIRLPRLK